MNKHVKKSVVIGAGPAGLCVGWDLSRCGKNVTILEKADNIGGLASSFKDGDYLFDLGPHNIHTTYKDILKLIKEMLKDDLRQHYPIVKIFFRGRFVSYPLKGIRVFSVLPLRIMPIAIFSFLIARLRLFFRDPKKDDSFESWLRNRFGSILYKAYFHPYAQKVWMIHPSKISKYVAQKRVPLMSISDYLRNLFCKPVGKHHSEDVAFIENYYPRNGIGQLTDWLYNKTVENKGRIECKSEVIAVNGDTNEIKSVTYCQDGALKTIEADMLFATLPLNELIRTLKLDVPDGVREAAEQLEYVSEILFFLKVNKKGSFNSSLVYFSDPSIRFNRLYDIGAFSEDCVPSGKTAYCIEFTCNRGETLWNTKPDVLFHYIMEVFEKNKMLFISDVDGYCVKYITHAYPRFKIGFEKNVRKILNYLSTIENLIVLGRQGLFCYANVDDALYMGLKATGALRSHPVGGINYSVLFPRHVHL